MIRVRREGKYWSVSHQYDDEHFYLVGPVVECKQGKIRQVRLRFTQAMKLETKFGKFRRLE